MNTEQKNVDAPRDYKYRFTLPTDRTEALVWSRPSPGQDPLEGSKRLLRSLLESEVDEAGLTSTEMMEKHGCSHDDVLTLIQIGHLQEVRLPRSERGFSFVSGSAFLDERYNAESKALREIAFRKLKFECRWKESGWRAESGSIVAEVLLDQKGHLSGTTRLVKGPFNQVAEVYFEPGEKPRVVAFYVPVDEDADASD